MICNMSNDNQRTMIVISRPSILFCKYYLGSHTFGAEIGVYCGTHAFQIIATLNPEKLYLVDPYCYNNDHTPANNIDTSMDDLKIAKDNLKSFPQTEFIIKPSIEAAKTFKDSSLDFVYIDAEHTYKSVCADIKAWRPKVRHNGVIAGHDFRIPGVMRAVKKMTKTPNVVADNIYGNFYHFGDDWWFINNDEFKYTHIA